MTTKKTIGLSMTIWGIVFLVYHLLVFFILPPVTGVFWLSYGFMLLAFVLLVAGMYYSFKGFTVQAVFFGIPLAQFTLFYFLAELFMSVVFMIFQIVPWQIPLLLQLILLAVYIIVAVISVGTRDAAVAQKDKVQNAAAVQRVSAVEIEMLYGDCKDPDLKNQLRRLGETIRYADPMTHPAVENLEMRIRQETIALQTYCADGATEEAKASCAALQRLYVERNKTLLAVK